MATVYVITRGSYSDYCICAVSLDKKKAEKLAKMYCNTYDNAQVEEWETDTVTDVNAINGRYPYTVTFYPNDPPWVYKRTYEYELFAEGIQEESDGQRLYVSVYAPDDAAALKIAAEKRAKYLAEKEGIT